MNSPVDMRKEHSIKIDHALSATPDQGIVGDGIVVTHAGGRSINLTLPLEAWLDLEEKLKEMDFNG